MECEVAGGGPKGVCARGEWNDWGGMEKEEFGDGGVERGGRRGRQRKVSSG